MNDQELWHSAKNPPLNDGLVLIAYLGAGLGAGEYRLVTPGVYVNEQWWMLHEIDAVRLDKPGDRVVAWRALPKFPLDKA